MLHRSIANITLADSNSVLNCVSFDKVLLRKLPSYVMGWRFELVIERPYGATSGERRGGGPIAQIRGEISIRSLRETPGAGLV